MQGIRMRHLVLSLRLGLSALVLLFSPVAEAENKENIEVRINHYTHSGCVVDGQRLLPGLAHDGGAAFYWLPRQRRHCLDTIDRSMVVCERATSFDSNTEEKKHPGCLAIFAAEIGSCLTHYNLERPKCEQSPEPHRTSRKEGRESDQERKRLTLEAERERKEIEEERERQALEEERERHALEAERERLALQIEQERLAEEQRLAEERERRKLAERRLLEEKAKRERQRQAQVLREWERQVQMARQRRRIQMERQRQLERKRQEQVRQEQADSEAIGALFNFGLGVLGGVIQHGNQRRNFRKNTPPSPSYSRPTYTPLPGINYQFQKPSSPYKGSDWECVTPGGGTCSTGP